MWALDPADVITTEISRTQQYSIYHTQQKIHKSAHNTNIIYDSISFSLTELPKDGLRVIPQHSIEKPSCGSSSR